MSKIFCGIDWAENHHDIALVDQDGTQLAKLRISDDSAGFHALLELLARHGDSPSEPIPVAIETPRGLLVAALRATRRKVYAINPLAAARYRSSVARAKSDAADARVILRTDMATHRPLPADSELVQAVAVLARAHQDAVWDKTQMVNRLRSHLREYYPAAPRRSRAPAHSVSTPATPAPSWPRRPPRRQPPGSPAASCVLCLTAPDDSAAGSIPKSNGSRRSSSSSTPPAGASTISRRPPRKRSSPTPTQRSSPASPDCR